MPYTVWRLVYHTLLVIILPFALLQLKLKTTKDKAYKGRWKERLGFTGFEKNNQASIHIHAASLGEVIAVTPLIEQLLVKFPSTPIVFTTATPTGSAKVIGSFGNKVKHCYLPFDLGFSVTNFLNKANPQISIIMEVELWPNFINQCHQRNIRTVVVNGRMTDKSARNYAKLGDFFKHMVRQLSLVLVTSQRDYDNYAKLGVESSHLHLVGNIKFDITIPEQIEQQALLVKSNFAERKILVAGSTHPDDEVQLLAAFEKLSKRFPELLLILVPRHPHRFDKVFQSLVDKGYKVARRSSQQPVFSDTQVLLGDTMGELRLWYACGHYAFVGGSIQAHGGHNPLEAAAFSLPIIMGENVTNCEQIVTQLKAAGGLETAMTSEQLVTYLNQWLEEPQTAIQQGNNARKVVIENQGALRKTTGHIEQLLNS
jgi:3-deoxy-D-manno-octulosonic-acid transferase